MARVGAVAAIFEERRVRTTEAPARERITGVDPNSVLVTIERHVVVLPDCPDWQKPETQNWKNLPMPNFGCANQTNLGLMVADPGDLVRGREMGPADAARTSLGIERYRTGEEEEIVEESISVE
jgi:pilus assembly protein CpaD